MQSSNSIAILPFVNMSSDLENEYFSDGITEEIINALAKIERLNVTSRTSSFYYKNKQIPIPEIGKALNVATILEGSVRVSDNTIRITAQLIRTKDDFHFWSERWDRPLKNIFAIQDEISLLIAEKLREYLGHFEIQSQLIDKQTDNIDAYECYLKGRYAYQKWNPDDIKVAMHWYQKAIDLDPNYAESYIALSECYTFMAGLGLSPGDAAWEQSAQLLDQAIALKSYSPKIYFAKANISFWRDRNFRAAVGYASKALSSKPSFALAHQFIALVYVLAGKNEKCIEHIKIAQYLDPLSIEIFFSVAYIYYMLGDYKKSLELLNQSLLENPKNILAHIIRCCCLLKLNQADAVLKTFEDPTVAAIIPVDRLGMTALAYLQKNEFENAHNTIQTLHQLNGTEAQSRVNIYTFLIHIAKGETDQALDWIARGMKNISTLQILLIADPLVGQLKSNPRYQTYYAQIFKDDIEISLTKKKKLLDEVTLENYADKLTSHIKAKKPYLDAGLSLRSLADQIGIHSNQLSCVINEKYKKNFNEFINGFRLETFKTLANDPKFDHISLIGLAFESGFNSKTVFNTYFKKNMGITPNQFLKNCRSSIKN